MQTDDQAPVTVGILKELLGELRSEMATKDELKEWAEKITNDLHHSMTVMFENYRHDMVGAFYDKSSQINDRVEKIETLNYRQSTDIEEIRVDIVAIKSHVGLAV